MFPHAEFFVQVSSDDEDEDMRSDLDRTGTTDSSLQDSDVIDSDEENTSSSRKLEKEGTDMDSSIIVDTKGGEVEGKEKPKDSKSQEMDGDDSGVK